MPDWPEQRDYSALVLAGQAVTGSVGTHACFSSVTCLTPLSLWCCPIPALRFACFIDVCAVCRAVPRRLSSGVCAYANFCRGSAYFPHTLPQVHTMPGCSRDLRSHCGSCALPGEAAVARERNHRVISCVSFMK